MTTIQDIRRANLSFLVGECEHYIGKERGAAAELSRRTGVPASFISQFTKKELHQGGRERAMGDETARKLEAGMSKPTGWMDTDRTIAKDWKEAAMLDEIRLLGPAQREAVMQLVRSLTER